MGTPKLGKFIEMGTPKLESKNVYSMFVIKKWL